MTKYTGSCLCGKVRYEVSEFETGIAHCHCSMCQKFHGAAFSTFAEVKLENIHWLSGRENLNSFKASNDTIRQFCNICGSSLLFISSHNKKLDTIELAIATLDNCIDLLPDAHIHTNSKAPWFDIKDTLPRYKGYRNGKKEK